MNRLLVRASCLALFLAVAMCAVSYGQPGGRDPRGSSGNEINVSYFYDNLAPDGQWFRYPPYDWCWTPYDVAADWRPYTDGHWEYTDDGWSWTSNEPWGWATYHYGRWFFDDSYGWVWVPGTEWAPAWVAWRYGDDYVGWAPLPPGAGWDDSGGLAFADPSVIQSPAWSFVPRRRILDVSIRLQVTSVARNITLLGQSQDVTRYEVHDGRPANVGLDVSRVESDLGQRVPRVKISDAVAPSRGGGQSVGNGAVGFFRPRVRPAAPGEAPAPTMVAPRNPVPAQELQRQSDQQRRKLESELNAEHSRLARDQASELRAHAQGAAVDEIRKRHTAEQQAFDAHAAQQRQVLAQRMQKQIVRPSKQDRPAKPGNNGNNGNNDKRGNRGDKGNNNANDHGQDKPGGDSRP